MFMRFTLVILLLSNTSWLYAKSFPVVSPDEQIKVTCIVEEDFLGYAMFWQGESVIKRSALGLDIQDQTSIAENLRIVDVSRREIKEEWETIWGASRTVLNHANELTLKLQENRQPYRRLEIQFRVYDDGIGFRYILPEQKALNEFTIKAERTEFRLAGDCIAWFTMTPLGVNIEGPVRLSEVFDVRSDVMKERLTPATMKLSETQYISIHEAALTEYASMNLMGLEDTEFGLQSNLVGVVQTATPMHTPWRTVQVARTPGGLVESDMLLNLNEPCTLAETDWIAPGAAMWNWRNLGARVGAFTYDLDTESVQRLIDFASAQGIPYCVIDAGWYGPERSTVSNPVTSIEEIDIQYLVDYARQSKVGLWLYINSVALREYNIDSTFTQYSAWGIRGIKHGFLSDNSQSGVEFSHHVLKKAAEYQLMYDPHEPIKPTGFRRTYPHIMSREYLQSLTDGHRLLDPEYYVTLPFVQMLGGPLDHNPGSFELETAGNRERVIGEPKSTLAAQVARSIVIFTGLNCLFDHGEAYTAKADAFEILKQMPMDWDESRVIHGAIGEYITLARRSGKEWFVGSLTDERARVLNLSLHFLKEGVYTATICRDTPASHFLYNREHYQVVEQTVDQSTTLHLDLAPGGGYAIWLRPLDSK